MKRETTRSRALYRASHPSLTPISFILHDTHCSFLVLPNPSFVCAHHPSTTSPHPLLTPSTLSLTPVPHSYLLNGNILAARTFITTFVAQLPQSELVSAPPLQAGDSVQLVQAKDGVVNFCQAAVLACQRANGDRNKVMRESWVRLCGTYQSRGGALAQPEVRKVSAMGRSTIQCYAAICRAACSAAQFRAVLSIS